MSKCLDLDYRYKNNDFCIENDREFRLNQQRRKEEKEQRRKDDPTFVLKFLKKCLEASKWMVDLCKTGIEEEHEYFLSFCESVAIQHKRTDPSQAHKFYISTNPFGKKFVHVNWMGSDIWWAANLNTTLASQVEYFETNIKEREREIQDCEKAIEEGFSSWSDFQKRQVLEKEYQQHLAERKSWTEKIHDLDPLFVYQKQNIAQLKSHFEKLKLEKQEWMKKVEELQASFTDTDLKEEKHAQTVADWKQLHETFDSKYKQVLTTLTLKLAKIDPSFDMQNKTLIQLEAHINNCEKKIKELKDKYESNYTKKLESCVDWNIKHPDGTTAVFSTFNLFTEKDWVNYLEKVEQYIISTHTKYNRELVNKAPNSSWSVDSVTKDECIPLGKAMNDTKKVEKKEKESIMIGDIQVDCLDLDQWHSLQEALLQKFSAEKANSQTFEKRNATKKTKENDTLSQSPIVQNSLTTTQTLFSSNKNFQKEISPQSTSEFKKEKEKDNKKKEINATRFLISGLVEMNDDEEDWEHVLPSLVARGTFFFFLFVLL
jgi:hypothetical protein